MPATLTATRNPVLVPKGQSKGKTTIAWNGAEQGRCRVYEVVGSAEQLVAPATGPGVVQGSVTLDIGLGTHVYRLKREAAPNPVVASVTVTVKLRNEYIFSSVEDGLLRATAIPVQAITRVTVSP